MSIRVKYRDLGEISSPRHPDGYGIAGGIARVLRQPMDGRMAFRFSKFARDVSKILQEMDLLRRDIVKRFAVTKADGTIDLNPVGIPIFPSEEAARTCEQALDELLGSDVEIPGEKIPEADLHAMQLSPETVLFLEPLIAITDATGTGS